MKVFLDTHVVVKLAEDARDVFGPRALELIDESALFFAPIVRLELALLHEIGRVTVPPAAVTERLRDRLGAAESVEHASQVISVAEQLVWTRDPFDRLIVATAQLHQAPLLTADARIREHYPRAVWG